MFYFLPPHPEKAEGAGYQWTPSGGSIVTGSAYTAQDSIASVSSYRALHSSDNYYWITKFDPAAGQDKRISIDGVRLQGANKLIITYEGYVNSASAAYLVQIYDRVAATWRTLNWRDATLTSASDATYTYEIYNGYWQSGGSPVDTPMANFVTDDANKRVQIRVYSTFAGAALHYWDRLQIEAAIDPVYYANSLTRLNGWTGTITNNYTWTNYADDQRLVATNQAGTLMDYYLSYTGIQTYTGANTIFLDLQSASSNVALTVRAQIYNFTTPAWENLNSTLLSNTTEASYYMAKNNITLTDYISANEVRIRFVTATANVYTYSTDRAYITIGSTNTDEAFCAVTFGSQAGGTTCSNTRTIDTTSADSTWQQATAQTAAAGYYPGDYSGTWGVNYSASSNLSVPTTIPDSAAVTGIKYAARFRSNVTTNTMMPSLKDMSGNNTSVVGTGYTAPGGWVDVSATNALTTYTVLEPAAYTHLTSPEDFIDTKTDFANMRMRTSASTAVAGATRDWDFALISIRYINDDTVAADNPQYIGNAGTLTKGTAVAVGATNTALYSGTLNSDNVYWQNQNTTGVGGGLDVRVSLDGVNVNNANKMIISYEGYVANAALVYYVQIYDRVNSQWRTLNDRGATLANTTDTSYYFSIFNGYWGTNNYPLANFVTADADKRVQLRIYSEYTSAAYTHYLDRFQLELGTDPVYWAQDETITSNNGDGVITSPSISYRAKAIAKDSTYMYVAGHDDTTDWRIEKRSLSDGTLDFGFGIAGVVTDVSASYLANAITIDSTYMYVGGSNESFNWRIEKRLLSDGTLDLGFGTGGVITGDSDSNEANAIAKDTINMYVAGYDDSGNWRIEKRLLSDGTLDAGFGTGGIVTGDPDSNIVYAIAIDSTYTNMYVVGDDSSYYDWRIEKRLLSDGTLDAGFGTGGVITGDSASYEAYAIAIDATYMYITGRDESPYDWRIEKRLLSDGTLVAGFGTGGVITGASASREAFTISIDSTYTNMYVAGSDDSSSWRIEKRRLSDGTLDEGFGTGGVVTSSAGYAYAIAIDTTNMYVTGLDNGSNWHTEKRFLSDGTLSTANGFGSLENSTFKETHPIATAAITTGGSDDQKMIVSNPSGQSFDYYLTFGNLATYTGANAIMVYYEGRTTLATMTYKVKIYNFNSSTWEDLSSTALANTTDTAYQFAKAPISNLADYISSGNIRIGFCTTTTIAANHEIDYVYATLGSVIANSGDASLTFGSTKGGSATTNTQSLDTSSNPTNWEINSSNTGTNPNAYDWAGQIGVNQQATGLINFSPTLGNNTPATGVRYAFRMLTNTANLTWQGYLRDYSGLTGIVGGWLLTGGTNASATAYTFTEGWQDTNFKNNEDYVDTFHNQVNLKLKPTISTQGSQITPNWDFAFSSLRWYENSASSYYNTQFTPQADTLTTGANLGDTDAVQNTGSYKAILASDDQRWVIKNDASAGLDVRANIDDVVLNNANKMTITYEGSVSNASAYYFVQIYDNANSVWRTLNTREVALNNTTETSPYYFTIFNGYWLGNDGALDTPLSNFISNDADKRVQLRFYSVTKYIGFTLAIDRVQAEAGVDPVYWPNDFGMLNQSTGVVTGATASYAANAIAKDSTYMYVAGYTDSPNDWRIEKRFLSNGALDTGFGTSGVITGASASYRAQAIAIDSIYMYLVGSTDSPNDWRIEKRLLSDGTLDSGFGTAGVVTGDLVSSIAYAIAIDSTYMYVAGADGAVDWRIEKRLLSDGTLDSGFGTGGVVTGDPASYVAFAIAKDSTYMYAAGYTDSPYDWRIEKRSLSNGTLDSGFGTGGVAIGDPASNDAYAIAIDSTYMYVAGRDTTTDWRIEKRLLSDGTLDSGFGTGGVITGDPASYVAYAIAIDSTYMYVAGNDETTDWRIEKRLLSDGTLDSGFGTAGVITGASTSNVAKAIAIDSTYMYVAGVDETPDWRIEKRVISTGALDQGEQNFGIINDVSAGYEANAIAKDSTYMYVVGYTDGPYDWRIEKRLLSDGTLDLGFGTAGVVTGDPTSCYAFAIAIDSTYMYVVGNDDSDDWRIEKRALSNGALDAGFGTGGVITGDPASNEARAIAIDSTYMYVAGYDENPSDWRIEKRTLSDGTLDSGFGTAGVVTSDPASNTANAIAIDSTYMYVAGYDETSDWRIEKRLLSDGTVDSGFGTAGVITGDPASNFANAIAIDSTYMYVAGFDGTSDWRIEKRSLSDGTLDTNFGTAGVITGDPASYQANAIAIDSTYMYVAGFDGTSDWRIEKRLLSDGSLETDFGDNGVITDDPISAFPRGIVIDSTSMYVAGFNNMNNWRIEKRLLSNGTTTTNTGSGFGNVDLNTYKTAHPIATSSLVAGGSDDQYLAVKNLTGESFEFYLNFGNIQTYTGANAIYIYYEGKTSVAGLTYNLTLFNYKTSTWTKINYTELNNTTDATHQFSLAPITNIGDYISGGNLRLGFYTSSTTAGTLSIDYAYATVGSVISTTGDSEISFGSEAGSTSDTNTQNIDTTISAGSEAYWGITTATTATNPYMGDWGGTYGTNDSGAANISFPVTIPSNAKVTNAIYAARFLSNSSANTIEYAIKDYGGALGTTGGYLDPGAVSNATTTYSFYAFRQATNPEDFINTTTDKMNMKIRTTASTDAAPVTYRWDFAFVAFSWTAEEDHASASHQYTGTGGSLEKGTGVAISATNVANYRGSLASDNVYWQNQNTTGAGGGLDVRVSLDGVNVNNANKMIISYEGYVANAALVYYVQIYDRVNSQWRTLNDRGAVLANTTDTSYYFSIFNGYWGTDKYPLSNFITADANKRVQLRIYSEYTTNAYTHYLDRFQLELGTDPVYWAQDATITSNSGDGVVTSASASNSACAIAKDSTYMYIAGTDGPNWRIEKRLLSDGTLDSGFGTAGVITGASASAAACAIAIDSTYMYVAGSDGTPDWRIEKRLLSDGTVDSGFGTAGVVTGDPASTQASAIAIDSTYMYVAGYDEASDWRIEKRLLSDGTVDSGFGTGGVVTGDPASNYVSAIAIDSIYMYVVGNDNTPNWRIEKRLLSDGTVDSGFGTGGVVTGDPDSNEARAIAIDSTYMYVVGNKDSPYDWRIEKRALLDGTLDEGFGTGGVVTSSAGNRARAIAIDSAYMYVAGDTDSPYDWRIEKRLLSDGTLDLGFGTAGVITSAGSWYAFAIAKDSTYMYVAGIDETPDWRIEKRALSNGALSTANGFGSLENTTFKETHPIATAAITTGGSDDQKMIVSNPAGQSFDYYLTFGNLATYTGANAIMVYYEGRTSLAAMTYKVKIYNFNSSTWEDLSSTALANTTDTAYQFAKAPISNLADYISSGNIRIGFYTTTTIAANHEIDYVYATLGSVVASASDAEITFGSTDGSSALNTQTLDTSLASPISYGINTAATSSDFYAYDYAAGLYNIAHSGAANINFNVESPKDSFVTGIRYADRYRSNNTSLTVQPNVYDYSGVTGVLGGWLAAGTANNSATYTFSEGFHNGTNNNAWSYNNDISNTRLRTTASTIGSSANIGWDFSFMSLRFATVTQTATVGSTGTQIANMNIPSNDNYVGGAFTFVREAGSANISSITISEKGTVNANSNLSNLALYYETVETCNYNGAETLFGTASSFNSSDEATVTGTMPVATSQICLYAVVDVGAGVSDDQTLEIEITNPSVGVSISSGDIAPASAVLLTGATTLNIPNSAPNSPSTLLQKKTTDDIISTGGSTDETSVKFTATLTDTNSDQVRLCVEKDPLGTAFSNTEDSCSGLVNSGETASITITNHVDLTQYHWQARAKDEHDEYSSWLSYGGNGENEVDYSIDITPTPPPPPTPTDTTPPHAVISATSKAIVNEEIIFDGSESSDNEGIASYLWDFGDNATNTQQKVTKTFSEPGVYTVSLLVKDAANNEGIASHTIYIYPPAPEIMQIEQIDNKLSFSGQSRIDVRINLQILSAPINLTVYSDELGNWYAETEIDAKEMEGNHSVWATTTENEMTSDPSTQYEFSITAIEDEKPPKEIPTIKKEKEGIIQKIADIAKSIAEKVGKSRATEALSGAIALALPLAQAAASAAAAAGLSQPFNFLLYLKERIYTWFGFRKRRKPWGIVFNDLTKKPLAFAKIFVYSWPENKLKETTISNSVGEFGFLLPAGEYYIKVQNIAGLKQAEQKEGRIGKRYEAGRTDSYYSNLYYKGEIIKIMTKEEQKSLLSLSIPLISIQKGSFSEKFHIFIHKVAKVIDRIRIYLLSLGTILSILSVIYRNGWIDWLILGLYVLFWIIEIYLLFTKAKPYGVITERKSGKPLDLVLLRLINSKTGKIVKTYVTGMDGKFIFSAPSGIYTISAVKAGYEPFFTRSFYMKSLSKLDKIEIKLEPWDVNSE